MTLGDFWGVYGTELQNEAQNGVSEILVNSEKGEKMLQELPDAMLQAVTKEAASRQPNLYHPSEASEQRENFWTLYRKAGYRKAARAYFKLVERIKVPYNRIKYRK